MRISRGFSGLKSVHGLAGLGLLVAVSSSVGCGSDAAAPPAAGAGAGGSASAGGPGAGGASAGAPSAGATNAGAGMSGAPSAGAANAGAPGAGSGGASAGSAGTAGSAGAAGSGGGGAKCVNAGTELCDDFESGKLDAARWVSSKSGTSTIAVETGTVHGGQYAVHFKFEAGKQSTVTIAETATFLNLPPNTPNKFYSRMWVYFGPDIPKAPTGDFHTGFMVGSGKNDKGDCTVGMGMIGSDQQWLGYSIFFGNPKYEFGPWSNPRIKAKEWQCIELLEDGSDPTTEIRKVWLNDAEMKELESDSAKSGGTKDPNHLPPKFDKVTFGVIEYHPIPTLSDMWIDDLKVSANPIGCAP